MVHQHSLFQHEPQEVDKLALFFEFTTDIVQYKILLGSRVRTSEK